MKGSGGVASPAFVTVAAHELAEEPATVDLATLYALHAASVARWAARLGGPGLDVEDAVHDVFLVVERRLASFRGTSSLKTWLYGITVNVVRHQRRKRRLLRWLGLEDAPEVEAIASLARTPAELLEQADATRLVYAVLDRLSETNRTVLVMHELEGLSGPEIAALTGVQPSTVWVRLHRARAAFLAALSELQEDPR